ncbi:MAG TPA: MFS transporter [Trueperaceae bacterium]|nr:MFS transporter [Trueperaceae bacterium]
MPPATTAPVARTRFFAPDTRSLTVGILLGVTLVAFESLAVVTVAPLFAADLGGVALYGWVFSGLLLASLVGAVAGGQLADTGSLARPLIGGLALFGAGLVVSGAAPSMAVLIVGRILQGLGGGALTTVMYAAITRAYPDSARARMMALTSSAWIVPALLGPTLAGLVAETLHWRWVFWGILPLLLLVGALTVRPFGALRPVTTFAAGGQAAGRFRAALVLAGGAGLLLVGIGVDSSWLAAALALPGLVIAVYSLQRLLPAGTLFLRRGLPSVVAGRGALFAAFLGVEAFLALMLTAVHDYSTAVTGAVIATGAISWAAGSWLQSRLDENHADKRGLRMFAGAGLLTLGIVGQLIALFLTASPLVVVVSGWVLAGLGIGMAHATASVLAFALAPPGEEGSVSAALQISDQLLAAVSTGVGGALFAFATRRGWDEQRGILLAFAFVMVLAGVALAAGWRSHVRRGGAG